MILKPSAKLLHAIAKYKSGDQSAFDTIYYESLKYVTKSVLNVLNRTAPEASEDLQQDIIQDTYLTIASKLDTLQNPEAFLQWAGQIATHNAQRTWSKDIQRQKMEQSEDDMVYELVDEDFIPEDILYNKEKQRMIRKILEELPTNQYLCVVEYFYNGLKETEVAEKLGMPVNTVKTNLSRAKKKLRVVIETKEKKSGVKLYSISGLLLLLLMQEVSAMASEPAKEAAILSGIHAEMASATGTATAVSVTGGAAAKTSAGASIFTKIGAGVLAAAITVGGAVGGTKLAQNLLSDSVNSEAIQQTVSTSTASTAASSTTESITGPTTEPTTEPTTTSSISVVVYATVFDTTLVLSAEPVTEYAGISASGDSVLFTEIGSIGSASSSITKVVILDELHPESTRNWFSGMKSLESIEGLEKINTEHVTDMSGMFSDCFYLRTIEGLGDWDVGNVTNMSAMFTRCSLLSKIDDLSNWNTKNVEDMGDMFRNCSQLSSIGDISGWDVEKVNNMAMMFGLCPNLTAPGDLNNWNVGSETNIANMFYNCGSWGELPLWYTG